MKDNKDYDYIVFVSNGKFAMTEEEYFALVRREMENDWENMDDEERAEYGTLDEYIKRDMDNWISNDDQYTYREVWLAEHDL